MEIRVLGLKGIKARQRRAGCGARNPSPAGGRPQTRPECRTGRSHAQQRKGGPGKFRKQCCQGQGQGNGRVSFSATSFILLCCKYWINWPFPELLASSATTAVLFYLLKRLNADIYPSDLKGNTLMPMTWCFKTTAQPQIAAQEHKPRHGRTKCHQKI